MNNVLEFKLDTGESAFIQITENEGQGRQRGSRGDNDDTVHSQAERKFTDALRCIAPIGNSLLSSIKDINTPDEIKIEFGFTFNAKAGVVITSIESEANFKVSLTWKNDKAP